MCFQTSQPAAVTGRFGTSHGTYESRSCRSPLGGSVSSKTDKSNTYFRYTLPFRAKYCSYFDVPYKELRRLKQSYFSFEI